MSQTTAARNSVIMLINWIKMHTVAKRQKLRKNSREEIMPRAKADAVVSDVMVMAGPAEDKASCTR